MKSFRKNLINNQTKKKNYNRNRNLFKYNNLNHRLNSFLKEKPNNIILDLILKRIIIH